MDIIDRIDELIAEAEKEPTWTAVQALRCLRKELQNEYANSEQEDGVLNKIYNALSVRYSGKI